MPVEPPNKLQTFRSTAGWGLTEPKKKTPYEQNRNQEHSCLDKLQNDGGLHSAAAVSTGASQQEEHGWKPWKLWAVLQVLPMPVWAFSGPPTSPNSPKGFHRLCGNSNLLFGLCVWLSKWDPATDWQTVRPKVVVVRVSHPLMVPVHQGPRFFKKLHKQKSKVHPPTKQTKLHVGTELPTTFWSILQNALHQLTRSKQSSALHLLWDLRQSYQAFQRTHEALEQTTEAYASQGMS